MGHCNISLARWIWAEWVGCDSAGIVLNYLVPGLAQSWYKINVVPFKVRWWPHIHRSTWIDGKAKKEYWRSKSKLS